MLWITAGLLLLLSLIRYSPADLRGPAKIPWIGVFFEPFADKSGQANENLIGPLGGLLGFLQFLLFGAAAALMPISLIWFGILKFALNYRLWPRVALGFGILLVSGAAWLHAADGPLKEWADSCHLNSPGGVVGNAVGGFIMVNLLGKVGTLIVTTSTYLIALILLVGQTPIHFAKSCAAQLWAFVMKRLQSRKEVSKSTAREEEYQAERQRQREQRKKERELARVNKEQAEAPDDGQAMLPLKDNPVPQIIDASQRRTNEPIDRSAKPFERKKSGHQFLSTGDYPDYELPGFDLLDADDGNEAPETNRDELLQNQNIIIETLRAFGIEVTPGDITRGPTITRYEIYPSKGLRVSRIAQLEADLARATCAERINILAPIPGKDT
ncbi:MAG: DNA translocase FtsK 4TM domain-containing protein, partial [Luteolibacter sp.]